MSAFRASPASDAELLDELARTPAAGEPPPDATPVVWMTDAAGRNYVRKPDGGKGMVFQRGDETVAEALERSASSSDRRPRTSSTGKKRGKGTPPQPDPPKAADLRELEQLLAEALKSPAMVAGMMGDEWLAEHFVDKGPYLARNLVKASETNPWLRRKLEEMAVGGDMTVQLLGMLSLVGAVLLYAAPPAIYLLNLPVPPRARDMLEIPDRVPVPEPMPHAYYPPAPEPVDYAPSPESPPSPLG